MAEPEPPPPTSAIVPVESAWSSKIIWTQIIGAVATIAALWGFDISTEMREAIVTAIVLFTGGVTFVFRKWFSASVTPASVAGAPVVNQQRTVAATTPPGDVVSVVKNG